MPSWLLKEKGDCVIIRATVQAISLAMANKVEFCIRCGLESGLSSVSGCCLLSGSLLGGAPILVPTPEFHGCLLSSFVVRL